MSNTVSVRYNGSDEIVDLPEKWQVIGVGVPGSVPPLDSIQAAVARTLAAPVGAPGIAKLCEGVRTVTIAVDDQLRPTPAALVLEVLLPSLRENGIADENVTVVVGKGTHTWPTDAQIRAKVGPAADRYKVQVHDPDSADRLTLMGTTTRGTPVWINSSVAEADLFIGIGAVVTHYMAGYGGGPKLVLPGVSGRQSIMANHSIGRSRDASQARTAGNPLYEDMLEAARIARLALKIDVVLDMNNQPVDVVAGDVALGHQAAIASYNRLFGFPVPVKADVTITSGFPLEFELLQSGKAVLSADLATRDGGAIILFSSCSNGVGPGFGEAMSKKPDPAEVWDWVADGRTTPTGGPMVARVREVLRTKRVIVVTPNLSAAEIEAMGFEYAATGKDAIAAVERGYPTAGVLVFPSGSAINPLP